MKHLQAFSGFVNLKNLTFAVIILLFWLPKVSAQNTFQINIDSSRQTIPITYYQFPDSIKNQLNESNSYVWLRFRLKNNLKYQTNSYYLFVNQQYTKKLCIDSTRKLVSQAGLLSSVSDMPKAFQPFYLNLVLIPQQEQVYYLKVYKPEGEIKLSLVHKITLDNQDKKQLREDYLLMGILLVMTFYNLILYGLISDRSYLYYVLYIGFLGLWIFHEYIYYQSDFTILFIISIANTFNVIGFNYGYLGFVRYFLKAKADFPVWNKILIYLQRMLIFPLVLVFIDAVNYISQPESEIFFEGDAIITGALSLVNVFSCLFFGLVAARKRSRLAFLFLIASMPLLLSGLYFGVEYIWLQPFLIRDLFSYVILRQMVILEIVLLALALAYRYNMLKMDVLQKEMAAEREKEKATQLKAQTENLQSLNQAKDKLFSIIGHDLRSPINSLQGALYLLNNQTISPEQFLEISQKLQKNVESLQFTFDNLFQWAYAQMGGIKTEARVINLTKLVEQNIELLQENADYKQLKINNLVNDDFWAWADENQINLVIRNLLNNAIKFTPKNGQITIQITQEKDFVIVSIKDNGSGIPPEIAEQLFKPNLLFSTRGTEGEKGTGLGLVLCREMIENNQGSIWVNSTLNVGSTFSFKLPRRSL